MGLSDTDPRIERLLIEGVRRMAPARRLALMADMTESVRVLLLAGLRKRYPDDPPERIRRRFADLWLGPELAARAYGPPPYED